MRSPLPTASVGWRIVVLCGSLLLVLLIATVFQWRSARVREMHPRAEPLSSILPAALAGWQVRDEPVAETEEMKRAVAGMLNFDEALVRVYQRGHLQISVYVAYWRPGRSHPRLVAQHTPDVCWTGAGWQMKEAWEIRLPLAGGQQTRPSQARIFEQPNRKLYVHYWHLVGGETYHSSNAQGLTFFRYLREDLLEGQREQYFIRVSCTAPLNELRDDPLMVQVWQALAKLGLREISNAR